ncbi:MAG: hypothetical protein IJT23_08095 [Clostridia bacterium]|nr:hypothetical protein [Clostridia bacterium]
MKSIDIILTVISAICTLASIIGAYRSNKYSNQSKQLNIYANTNAALIETKNIISTLTELLKLANNRKRGTSLLIEIRKHGEMIRDSINKIRDTLPANDVKEINNILNTQEIKIDHYINSFVTGAILVSDKLELDDDFNLCHQKFCDIQVFIKAKLENLNNK